MNIIKAIAVMAMIQVFATACASIDPSLKLGETIDVHSNIEEGEWVDISNEAVSDHVIAKDLIRAITQLPAYSPQFLTVQISEPSSEYGRAISTVLKESGYGIQKVTADQGKNYVLYSKSIITTDIDDLADFRISINDLIISRKYKIFNSGWIPTSPMYIEGVARSDISLDNNLFAKNEGQNELQNNVIFSNNKRAEPVVLGSNKSKSPRVFQSVSNVVLTFDDKDARVLGNTNKRAISELTKRFDLEKHRFTIRACGTDKSISPTEISNIVNARHRRINNELLNTGVPRDSIVMVGCESSLYREDRYAVLSLQVGNDSL